MKIKNFFVKFENSNLNSKFNEATKIVETK